MAQSLKLFFKPIQRADNNPTVPDLINSHNPTVHDLINSHNPTVHASPQKSPADYSELPTSREVDAPPNISESVCKNSVELSIESPISQGKKRNCKVRFIASDSDEEVNPSQPVRKIALPKRSKTCSIALSKKSLLTELQSSEILNIRQNKIKDESIESPEAAISTSGTNRPDKSFEEHCVKRLKITNNEMYDSSATKTKKETDIQNTQTPDQTDTCALSLKTGCEFGTADHSINTATKTDDLTVSPQSSEKNIDVNSKSIPAINFPTVFDGSAQNNPTSQKSELPDRLIPDTEYSPNVINYDPVHDACWTRGNPVSYLALARTFQLIEDTASRLKIQSILTNYFLSLMILATTEELISSVYLTLNKVGTSWSGQELGIGEGVLVKALAQATGRSQQSIKEHAQETGDLGVVAEASRCTQKMMFKPQALTILQVFAKLKDIAMLTGTTSQQKKVEKIAILLVACRHCEARYLIRSLSGKLRIGLAEQSILTSLGHAAFLRSLPKEKLSKLKPDALKEKLDAASSLFKSVYCELPDYERVLPKLLANPLEELSVSCPLTPGVPLKPMLAHPSKGLDNMFKRIDQAAIACEYKYDGERAQIHVIAPGEVYIFSRNQEDSTNKFIDVVDRISNHLKDTVQSCIIDSEVVAWDIKKKQILPFQILSTRKKKDVTLGTISVQVCVYAFDLLYLNGKSLVKSPFRERSSLLREHCEQVEGQFMFAHQLITNDSDDIQELLNQSIRDQCEGLMVKTLDQNATYQISKRSFNWLKLKKDYLEGLGDTLDLVVIGGYHGTGKRTGTYGGFLLACYDAESEEYQSICKTGTGFSESQLDTLHRLLKEHVIPKPKPYYNIRGGVSPDVWFDSVQVWEIKAADLSLSPIYTAAIGLVDPERGVSLRFPRFIRVRDDKTCEEATSAQQVAEMYRNQESVSATINTGKTDNNDDFY